jgi:glycosyltransferase involved in cell wall biosynthesis
VNDTVAAVQEVPANISVVVSAYTEQRWQNLVDCLDSLARQTVAPLEIIVVVDHNPQLLERLRAAQPGAVVVANEQPRGLSGARNTGWQASRADVVAFLDDDAVAASDWLEKLLAAYRGPEIAGTGGHVEPMWIEGRPAWFPAEFDWVVGCSYRGQPLEVEPVRNLIGCNMSFRRSYLEALSGFRDGIGRAEGRGRFSGCEETEFCIRLRQRYPGQELLYVPEARVVHSVPGERARLSYFLGRCYSEGLSKADVTSWVGTGRLGVELNHSLRVLPAGVGRALRPGNSNGGGGVARAGAIVAGFAVTASGYLVGRVATPGRVGDG